MCLLPRIATGMVLFHTRKSMKLRSGQPYSIKKTSAEHVPRSTLILSILWCADAAAICKALRTCAKCRALRHHQGHAPADCRPCFQCQMISHAKAGLGVHHLSVCIRLYQRSTHSIASETWKNCWSHCCIVCSFAVQNNSLWMCTAVSFDEKSTVDFTQFPWIGKLDMPQKLEEVLFAHTRSPYTFSIVPSHSCSTNARIIQEMWSTHSAFHVARQPCQASTLRNAFAKLTKSIRKA